MADKPNTKASEEPSIEEILGSIRRIIAEDDEPGAAEESTDLMDEEPLELTNKIEPDGTIVNAAPPAPAPVAPAPVEVAVEEPVDIDAMFANVEPSKPEPVAPKPEPEAKLSFVEDEPVKPAPIVETKKESAMAQEPETMLSDVAANATAAAMSKLTRHSAVTEEGHDGVTIENIVREMLKPLLREWLDKNLPDLVQKMVERELEKLSKRV